MLFNLVPAEKTTLQRQLDADSYRFSRELQLQTDAAFDAAEVSSFEMTGLYAAIPGNNHPAIPLDANPHSAIRTTLTPMPA